MDIFGIIRIYFLILMIQKGNSIIPEGIPLQINNMQSVKGQYNIESSYVKLLDTRSMEIGDFNFNGKAPSTFFFIGNGTNMMEDKPPKMLVAKFKKIPNDSGSCKSLSKYDKKTIKLTLPNEFVWGEGNTYLVVHSLKLGETFSYIEIPLNLELPSANGKVSTCPAGLEENNTKKSSSGSTTIYNNLRMPTNGFSLMQILNLVIFTSFALIIRF